MFHESFMEEKVSRMFQVCFMIFKGVSRVFQRSFKKTFKVFQKSFMLHGTHRSFPSRRRACFIKAKLQNIAKIIEIGTFLKNRDPPPSVFKIPKLKLGHFCFFLPLPPYWNIVPNFLDFLF